MADIYTLHSLERPFTETEQRNYVQYLVGQIALGTTDGVQTQVRRAGLEHVANLTSIRWSTTEAAEAFLAWLNALTPAPTFSHTFTFGEAQDWANNIVDNSPNQTAPSN
jgi:hypothetical protein